LNKNQSIKADPKDKKNCSEMMEGVIAIMNLASDAPVIELGEKLA
jgi:hypothetical protein